MSRVINCSRRGFLQGLVGGGAFLLGVRAGLISPEAWAGKPTDAKDPFAPSIWLAIDAAGVVSVVAHRSEMGTGIRTVLPLVIAEELDCDRSKVRIVQAVGDKKYGSQDTDGSRSIRKFYGPMREAGAAACLMLRTAAAQQWKVDVSETRAENHHIVHPKSGRRLGFGALAEAAGELPVPGADKLVFKSADQWRFVGKSAPIEDLRGITTGAAQFGLDVRRPGMKFATVVHAPVLGSQPKTVDDTKAKAIKGLEQVITIPGFEGPHGFQPLGGVALIGRDTWSVLKARRALKVEWTDSPHASLDSAKLQQALVAEVSKPGAELLNRGDAAKALASAAKRIEATYTTARLAHASMEPPAAVAEFKGGKVECWAPTQNPQAARTTVAKTLGLDEADVTVHVTLLGGGFGRKSKPDYVAEAAWLSRKVGAPVQVVWTREDDIRHDYFHAPAAVRIEAGLDAKNKPVAWLQRTAFPTLTSTFRAGATQATTFEADLGFTDVPWAVPNLRGELGGVPHHTRIGWYRAVCNLWHAFAVHSAADELAHAAGADPLSFLRELIGPDRLIDPSDDGAKYANYGEPLADYPIDTARLRRVLDVAAEKIGWGRKLGDRRGLGIAVHRSFLTYVACACEVEVGADGSLSIPRFVITTDCGLAVNPDRVISQMEGSVIFGLSMALHSEITAKNGAIVEGNFHNYRIARLTDSPKSLEVVIVGDGENKPTGVGEPGVPPVAPALANAIFAATGVRLRRLPFDRSALAKG